ncbi:hypothetical protein V6N11_017506 [Hibiscus sabdariffa]|uniref:Uncharacterized protein n=1 Tax=Hibiscus sabdariffa TaxID=183260 RepID=A0ABR2TY84_9ROSI
MVVESSTEGLACCRTRPPEGGVVGLMHAWKVPQVTQVGQHCRRRPPRGGVVVPHLSHDKATSRWLGGLRSRTSAPQLHSSNISVFPTFLFFRILVKNLLQQD